MVKESLAVENGNGTVAKLIDIRRRYLQDLNSYRKRRREECLGEIVDVVVADPVMGEPTQTPKPTNTYRETITVTPPPTLIPPPEPQEVEPAEAVKLAPPGKQPLKSYRLPVYGHCPACNAAIFEAQAKFCSQCSYPLDEGSEE